MVGGKETVVDDGRTLVLAIAYEAAVVVALGSLESAVELTAAYRNRRFVAQTGNEAAVGIVRTVDGHRRATVLNSDIVAIEYVCYQTARILSRGLDASSHVQVLDGGVANIAEGSHVLLRPVRLGESQRMAVAVEHTTIVSAFGYTHMLTRRDVSIEAGVDVLRICSLINHHGKFVPVSSVADGEVVVRHLV